MLSMGCIGADPFFEACRQAESGSRRCAIKPLTNVPSTKDELNKSKAPVRPLRLAAERRTGSSTGKVMAREWRDFTRVCPLFRGGGRRAGRVAVTLAWKEGATWRDLALP
jgi:hypothetical protein